MEINSSLIARADFRATEKELYITFNNGKEYMYLNFPVTEWDAFVKAESRGQFFSKNIKGKYNYKIIKQ